MLPHTAKKEGRGRAAAPLFSVPMNFPSVEEPSAPVEESASPRPSSSEALLTSPSLESESPLNPLSSAGFFPFSAPFLESSLTTGPLGGPDVVPAPFFTSFFH
mmetsp:Transcript_4517/g.13673  ORF Transcript_4517/g.13673 Transcript_4517/m.13673 type:complete len:103 (-) Transcript_4517:106-414(-)